MPPTQSIAWGATGRVEPDWSDEPGVAVLREELSSRARFEGLLELRIGR